MTMMVSCAAMLAGCGGEIDDVNMFNETADSNKTQLYVGYYNGGLGVQKRIRRPTA